MREPGVPEDFVEGDPPGHVLGEEPGHKVLGCAAYAVPETLLEGDVFVLDVMDSLLDRGLDEREVARE